MAYLYSRYIITKFEKYLLRGLILDVGCGKGGFGAIVRTVPEKALEARIVGLDLDVTALRTSRCFYDYLVCGSAGCLPFVDRVFDVSFSVEVLEHLTKLDGLDQVQEMERVTEAPVAIITPSHYFPQDSIDGSSLTQELMKHKSFFSSGELRKLGYQTEGLYPAREWIPPVLSAMFPYLACSVLACKMFKRPKISSSNYLPYVCKTFSSQTVQSQRSGSPRAKAEKRS